DSSVMSAVLLNPSDQAGEWLEPSAPQLDVEGDRRLLVEIPIGFTEMQLERPDLALEWRLHTRSIFQAYLARGYRVVDFFLSREVFEDDDVIVLLNDVRGDFSRHQPAEETVGHVTSSEPPPAECPAGPAGCDRSSNLCARRHPGHRFPGRSRIQQ